ncbi:MAG: alpha/beta hydrolase [Gemmatimonadaceae bacterium]
MTIREHHIPVSRTARYCTTGGTGAPVREVWFVCHGYAQLAARFIRHFEPVAGAHRLIVAPEALSRFYVERAGQSHAHVPVGASWMTREDRLSEIDDYVEYLDALYAAIFQQVSRADATVLVLGFSQGVATAARWVSRGAVHADQLVLWGGLLPADLEYHAAVHRLRETTVTVVVGDDDHHVRASDMAAQAEQLAAHDIFPQSLSYPGGHRLDPNVLRGLAAGMPTRS